ncbi:MAG: hypothetical protein LBG28_12560 [Tannerella sp.]|jgi:hypothetical protein|nr:hypothetical protein [Tannerella sp.]
MRKHNQHTKIRPKPLSPVEQLLNDRRNIEAQCRKQEQKLAEDFACLRDNASRLLFPALSSLLFSSGGFGKKTNTDAIGNDNRNRTTTPFATSAYFAVVRDLLPTVWNIIRPMLITWGINKAKSLIYDLFFGNKKRPSRN